LAREIGQYLRAKRRRSQKEQVARMARMRQRQAGAKRRTMDGSREAEAVEGGILASRANAAAKDQA
jgi:hypothetical protein